MSANPHNFLEDLAEEITGRLNAEPYFVDIPIRAEHLGTSADMIANAADSKPLKKGGKVFGAVVVQMPDVMNDKDQGPAGALLKVQVVIEIFENAMFNRGPHGTGKKRGAVAANILRSLKGFLSGYLGMTQALTTEGRVITSELSADGQLRLMVRMVTDWPMTFGVQVATPTKDVTAVDGGRSVALLCATADAELWYTTKGNGYPSPQNPLAVKYTTSLPYANDATDDLRVVAYKAGLLASHEAWVEILPVEETSPGGRVTDEGDRRVTNEGDARVQD